MDKWTKEFLERMKKERASYSEMIDFCCDSLVLNNDIQKELEQAGFCFDIYCGDYSEYYDEDGKEITSKKFEEMYEMGVDVEECPKEIYQQYIISDRDAERLEEYTNELVLYCEKLDLYLLCVTHFGTAWQGVAANWKEPTEDEQGDGEE